ncbi:MAG: response regulator [Clostridia bacterium]|nr:response regulator [Clostridia bacterium]
MDVRILIVDDEPEIAEGLALMLSTHSSEYRVVGCARDGLEGFDRAIELHPDIVITDIRMPQASGLDMIRDIKAYEARTEYIVISGYADFEYAKRAMEYGVQYFLTKPIDEEELFSSIEKLRTKWRTQEEYVEMSDLFPAEMLDAMEEAMAVQDRLALKRSLTQLFGVLRSHQAELSPENLRMLCLNLVLYGTRRYPYASLRINSFLGKNVLSSRSVSRMDSLDEMENWTYNLLRGAGEILDADSTSGQGDLVAQAKAYIQEHFASNITLNEISERFYVNPYYFSQLFKKKTGTSYQKYLTELRMKRAEVLLRETDRKIYEICEQVGYTDVNYFSKLFERTTGKKPSAFRMAREVPDS